MSDTNVSEEVVYSISYDPSNLPADPAGWWLVFEGDWGGQIYLTVPLSKLGAGAKPQALLKELDAHAWSGNEGQGAVLYLHSPELLIKMSEQDTELSDENRAEIKDGAYFISGGMGGGVCRQKLWLHDSLKGDASWKTRARELLKLT